MNRVWLGMVVLAMSGAAFGQTGQESAGAAARDYNWEDAAKAEGLTPEDIAKLRTDKVLISAQSFRQVFEPYIASSQPLFITSDSLLNAFHVLFEESVLRMERANARRLPGILRFIWAKLPESVAQARLKPELIADGRLRAQVTIATALRLCGDRTTRLPAEIEKLVAEEVKRVESAQGVLKPKWLGPPDDGFVALDYTRYKPRGFYTRTEPFQRYFRAVSWLQSIPFRVERDEELLAILLLGNALAKGQTEEDSARIDEARALFRGFNPLIGPGDDWDIVTAANAARGGWAFHLDNAGLSDMRKYLLEPRTWMDNGPRINDLVRLAPTYPLKKPEVEFRVISAYRTPDAVLFQLTTGFGGFDRFPSGLDVCAALGSTFASSKITYRDRDKLLKTIDQNKALFKGDTLYLDYLGCLAALLAEPEPDAPPFMKTDPWKTKSCQTALAGWAQLRHTWALQAKTSVDLWGAAMTPGGLVEPNPEFFARLGRLADKTEKRPREAGVMEPDNKAIAEDIRVVLDLIKKKDLPNKGEAVFDALSHDEWRSLNAAFSLLAAMDLRLDIQNSKTFWPEAVGKLSKLADDLAKDVTPRDPRLAQALRDLDVDIAPLWRSLGDTCRRLEALAHKQLRGVPWSPEEDRFLKDYGATLAAIMLYRGSSYLVPSDDAPRVVDVFYNPRRGECLEVGIGRPHALYVLYPMNGREVLTLGAVTPYFEFRNATRLTDAEWKALLDSDNKPDSPEWLKPILGKSGARPPANED